MKCLAWSFKPKSIGTVKITDHKLGLRMEMHTFLFELKGSDPEI